MSKERYSKGNSAEVKSFYTYYERPPSSVAVNLDPKPHPLWSRHISNAVRYSYVAIELKAGPFKPEYAGKLNFYLTAPDKEVKLPKDNPSIGLIICKDRNQVIAEYALRGLNKPIGVSRYELETALPDDLKNNLPTVEEMEAELKDAESEE